VIEVITEPLAVPDLAEAVALGPDLVPGSAELLEPGMGTVPLVAILLDVHRDPPDDRLTPISEFQDALFGSHSLQDYDALLSDGKFGVADAGI
jgi:hypothetical protein